MIGRGTVQAVISFTAFINYPVSDVVHLSEDTRRHNLDYRVLRYTLISMFLLRLCTHATSPRSHHY